MKTADIYIITNLVNGKQYVGQTTRGYMVRWKTHCNYANRRGERKCPQLIDRVIDMYGIENFKVELLETVSVEEKDVKEQYYIDKFDTYNTGYNITVGGDYNPMSDSNVKQHHKQVMQSDLVRNKISKSVKNSYTDDLRDFFRKDTKQKWKNKSAEERKHTISGLIKYNNSKKQPVGIIDSDGNILKVFGSCAEACRYCDRPIKEAGHILNVCDKYNKYGKRAKHFGYYWTKL